MEEGQPWFILSQSVGLLCIYCQMPTVQKEETYSEVVKQREREMPWKVLECQKSKATFQKQKQQGSR